MLISNVTIYLLIWLSVFNGIYFMQISLEFIEMQKNELVKSLLCIVDKLFVSEMKPMTYSNFS